MAAIPWLAHATWQYLTHSAFFTIESVTVEGNHVLQETEIKQLVHSVGGDNVLRVRKSAIRKELMATGWVKSVSIERSLPSSVIVRIEEFSPVATLMLDRMYLLESSGFAFREVQAGDPLVQPLLTGFTNPGNAYQKRVLQRSLVLLEIYKAAGLNEFDSVALIHHDPAKGYTFVTDEHQIVAHIGHKDFPQRMQRIRFVIQDSVRRTQRPPRVVHADLKKNQVVILPSEIERTQRASRADAQTVAPKRTSRKRRVERAAVSSSSTPSTHVVQR
jgi:cell division protein FtsQ